MTTALLSALLKFDHITAAGIYLTPAQAAAVRELLGGRLAVRRRVKAATEQGTVEGDEARMYAALADMDGVKEE